MCRLMGISRSSSAETFRLFGVGLAVRAKFLGAKHHYPNFSYQNPVRVFLEFSCLSWAEPLKLSPKKGASSDALIWLLMAFVLAGR